MEGHSLYHSVFLYSLGERVGTNTGGDEQTEHRAVSEHSHTDGPGTCAQSDIRGWMDSPSRVCAYDVLIPNLPYMVLFSLYVDGREDSCRVSWPLQAVPNGTTLCSESECEQVR